MNPGTLLARLSAARRQQLQVAAAVAREEAVQLHAERALLLLHLAADRVAPLRMLEIYFRLHGLTGVHAEVVGNRVLASLGSASGTGIAFVTAGPADESMFGTLRRRLRGRVHDELRRAVELHTGVTQTALLELHVRHAHGCARALANDHPVSAACALYADMVAMPPALTPVLQALVLNRVAADGLEAAPDSPRAAADARAAADTQRPAPDMPRPAASATTPALSPPGASRSIAVRHSIPRPGNRRPA